MISTETILSRFRKTVMEFSLFEKAPMLVNNAHTIGLTFKPTECLEKMHGMTKHELMEPIKLFPYFEFEDGNDLVFWDTNRMLEGLRILDSKPFRFTKVLFMGNFPLLFLRNSIGVFLTPETIAKDTDTTWKPKPPKQDFIPSTQYWISHLGGALSTWWSVLVTDHLKYSETYVKCRSCGFELGTVDYLNRGDHLCSCVCGCQECRKINAQYRYFNEMAYFERDALGE